jgi:putative oxidoreductase
MTRLAAGRDARAVAGIVLGSNPRVHSLILLALRLTSGSIFLGFGVGKFSHREKESASFSSYGLPFPDEFVYAIGATELVFGSMLILGLLTRLAALALAGDMIGAIVTAGRVEGGPINLGLAPALLAAMLVLLWTGPGRVSLDALVLDRLFPR